MLGYSDEDEEALRTTLPEFQKNAQLVLLPRINKDGSLKERDGKMVFVDLSYLDPLQVFKEPMIAFFRAIKSGDSLLDILGETAIQTLAPVLSEQLFVGAVANIARNRRGPGGSPIWNEMDSTANKTKAMLWHLIEAGGPGMLVGTVPRIYKAAKGEVLPSGRSYNLGAEIAAPLTGQRIAEVDVQMSLRQAVGRYKGNSMSATQLLSNLMTSRGTVNPRDIAAAAQNARRAKREAFEELKDYYDAAIRLGLSKTLAIQTLRGVDKDTGIGNETAKMIIADRYQEWQPSKQMLEVAMTREGGRERVQALVNWLREEKQKPRD